MVRCRLKNHFLKNRSEEDEKVICKQRNKCVSLLRKSERDYFANLNKKNITDNKRFWKTVKPFLSKKFIFLKEQISLKKKTTLYYCDGVVLEIYFGSQTPVTQEGLNSEYLAYEVVT